MRFTLGPYKKELASKLKIESGNYPGHGKLKPPPAGARIGYGIYQRDNWAGFVELTYPYLRGKDKTTAYLGVGVLPKYRKLGLAEWASRELLRKHPEIKKWKWAALEVNEPSLHLGKKLGFTGPKTERGYTTMEKVASAYGSPARAAMGHATNLTAEDATALRKTPRYRFIRRFLLRKKLRNKRRELYKKFLPEKQKEWKNFLAETKGMTPKEQSQYARKQTAKHYKTPAVQRGNQRFREMKQKWEAAKEKTSAILPVKFPKTTKCLQKMTPKGQTPTFSSKPAANRNDLYGN